MLRVNRISLAKMEAGYAVAAIRLSGIMYYLAGSEAEGGGYVLISSKTKAVFPLDGIDGGIMSFIPIPEQEGAFLAIRKFYPVFRSEEAEIVYVQMIPTPNATVACKVQVVCSLPFVHRIALVGKPENRKIIAATLCGEKSFVEDWSSPGAVYEIRIPRVPGGVVSANPILLGLHKNHGMYLDHSNGEERILVGAEEGVFELREIEDGTWMIRKVMAIPTSDMWLSDIDGDGKQEMAVIQPFHGNELAVYRMDGMGYEKVFSYPMEFGHVVWMGELLGGFYVIGCSRGGKKEISIHRLNRTGGGFTFDSKVIREGLGIAQIAVFTEEDQVHILTSDHGINEIGEFILTRS